MKTSGRNFSRFTVSAARVASVLLAGGLLAACQQTSSVNKASRSIPSDTLALMERKGTTKSSPIVIRAYKKEAELEVWKMKGDGEYVHIKTFPMCRWSGQLGPKRREGDRQVPEGFYAITPGQMNPNSQYHLSFNVGYPNALDRVQGFTGGAIMVHGACSSAGCFSMTDQQIEEIYAIAREAFAGGQRQIQMQSYPFRMTPENLAKHRLDPNMAFWRTLKEGSDRFEVTKREPQVAYCGRRYVFDATSATGESLSPGAVCPPLRQDPQIAELVAEKARADDAKVAELVSRGVQPVKMVYHDGGQHPCDGGQPPRGSGRSAALDPTRSAGPSASGRRSGCCRTTGRCACPRHDGSGA
jgi:murein L,D-transpeptidase YafK